jgi:hypothetical protein
MLPIPVLDDSTSVLPAPVLGDSMTPARAGRPWSRSVWMVSLLQCSWLRRRYVASQLLVGDSMSYTCAAVLPVGNSASCSGHLADLLPPVRECVQLPVSLSHHRLRQLT